MPIIGGANAPGPGKVISQEVTFTEATNTGGTYIGSVTVPPLSWIIDIRIYGQAVWTSVTSASLIVGDGVDPDGWFAPVNAKATDLLANEVLTLDSAGGKSGAYHVVATGLRKTMWSTLERVITGKITTVTTAGSTAGRTRMLVLYTIPVDPIPAIFTATE